MSLPENSEFPPTLDVDGELQSWVRSCWKKWGPDGPPSWRDWCGSIPAGRRADVRRHLSILDDATEGPTEAAVVSTRILPGPDDDTAQPSHRSASDDSTEEIGAATVTIDGQPAAVAAGPSTESGSGLPPVPGFQMHRELGRGGMGIVYQATDLALRRLVVLKMILGVGKYDAEQQERFQAEAQAMAQLHHPGIVHVYGVGQFSGSPYIVCEFVEGSSLDRQLRGEPQSPTEAARIVETVARSIHFAHQRGIIHRDLKPANILVDHQGRLKVTDFGLAKRLDGGSQLETRTGAIMGTPSYMAPEQARGAGSGLSPATDVYALGAILYELLTGRPPFRSSSVMDTLKQVIDESPAAPRTLNSKVPRDLETVCLKCLRKEAVRRYASAEELAEELARFQRGEPVLARPVGVVERAWRWGRRNPRFAALSTAVLLLLLLVAAGATTAAIWLKAANGEKQEALTKAVKAQRDAELALASERVAKQRAKEAIDNYVVAVGKNDLLGNRSFQELRLELLSDALRYYQSFVEQPEAAQDRRELAQALGSLGRVNMMTGSPQEAEEAIQRAVDIYRALAEEAADDPQLLDQLGDSLEQLAVAQSDTRKPELVIGTFEECVRVLERACAMAPTPSRRRELGKTRANFALALERAGRPEEAERQLKLAEALGRDSGGAGQPSEDELFAIANRRNTQGLTKQNAGRYEEAVVEYDAALQALNGITSEERKSIVNVSTLRGVANLNRGLALGKLGRFQECRDSYQRAIVYLGKILRANPQHNQYRVMLAAAEQGAGQAAARLQQWEAAREHYQHAVDLHREQVAENPTGRFRHNLAETLSSLAEVYVELGDSELADTTREESRQLLAANASSDTPDAESALQLGMQALTRTNELIEQQRYEEVVPLCSEALEALQSLPADEGEDEDANPVRFLTGILYANRAKALRELDELERAEEDFRRAFAAARESIERKERANNQPALVRFTLLWLAQVQRRRGRLSEAVQSVIEKREVAPSRTAQHLFDDAAELLACAVAGERLEPPSPAAAGWRQQAFRWLDAAAAAGLERNEKISDDQRVAEFRDDPQWRSFYEALPKPATSDE